MGKLLKMIFTYPMLLIDKIFLYIYYEFSKKEYYYRDRPFAKSKQKVLVISAGENKELLGLAAGLLRHKENQDQVKLLSLDSSIDELLLGQVYDGFYLFDENSSKEEKILRLKDILEAMGPDIIYCPFIIDADGRNLYLNRILLGALEGLGDMDLDIYIYEVNTRLRPRNIDTALIFTREEYRKKQELLSELDLASKIDLKTISLVDRGKRYIVDQGYALESFRLIEFEALKSFDQYLRESKWEPSSFMEVTSIYNLILAYLKNKSLKNQLLDRL